MQSTELLYFAYGSNLHPLRLEERINSARFVGVGTCQNRRLSFHKHGKDGSGKCDLVAVENGTTTMYGALYRLRIDDKTTLDRIEGKGVGYIDYQISVQHDQCETSCYTYLAQNTHIAEGLRPYHWYKKLVTLGAEYLEFPKAYIDSIKDTESYQDSDSARKQLNENLIDRMTRYQS